MWQNYMESQKFSLLVKHKKQIKHVSVRKNHTSTDLSYLIANLFDLKDKIAGLADRHGQVFDLQWVCKNLSILPKGQPFALLIENKQSTESMLSFGTQRSKNSNFSQQDNPPLTPNDTESLQQQAPFLQQNVLQQRRTTHERENQIFPHGPLGLITDLQGFQHFFLQDNQISVVFSVHSQQSLQKISGIRYYYMINDGKQLACVYYSQNRILQIPMQSWYLLQKKVKNLQKMNFKQQNKSNYSFDPSRPFYISFLQKMYQLGQISQNQYLRLKCQALQNSIQFTKKYSIRQNLQYQDFFMIIMAYLQNQRWSQRQLKSRNGCRAQPRQTYHNQIPIIVRRNGNVIQKLSTDWPLTFEQQRYIQVVNQLQLKGLLQDHHSRTIRTMIFQQSLQVARIVNAYMGQQIQQMHLAKALQQIVEKRRQRAYTPDSPQARSQMLTQVLKRQINDQAQLKILLKMAQQFNQSLLAAFQIYLTDSNQKQFQTQIQKILKNRKQTKDNLLPQFGRRQKSS